MSNAVRGACATLRRVGVMILLASGAACSDSTKDQNIESGPFAQGIPESLDVKSSACRTIRQLYQSDEKGAVYFDSGLHQRTYFVRDGVFDAGRESPDTGMPYCEVKRPDGQSNTRTVLANGNIEYRSVRVANADLPYTDSFTLIIDNDGQFKSCTGETLTAKLPVPMRPIGPFPGPPVVRPYVTNSACGEAAPDLPGFRAPEATLSQYSDEVALNVARDNLTDLKASDDGTIIAYQLSSLSPANPGGTKLLNRNTGVVEHIGGRHLAISGDGRYLVMPDISSGFAWVYPLQLRDLQTGTLTDLISGGTEVSISFDGQVIATETRARPANQTEFFFAVTVLNRTTGQQWQVDNADRIRMRPRVTRNGRYVSFVSMREDLAADGSKAAGYRLDTSTGDVEELVKLGPRPFYNAGLLLSEDGQFAFYGDTTHFKLRNLVSQEERPIVVDTVRDPLFETAAFARNGSLLVFETNDVRSREGSADYYQPLTVLYDIYAATWRAFAKDYYQFGDVGQIAVTRDGTEIIQFEGSVSGLRQIVVRTP